MAGVVKKAFQTVQDTVSKDKKKDKAGNFMHGLKEFVTSPGGLLTLALFALTIWYIHHKTAEE